MDRRKFLQGSGATFVSIAALQRQRLFGKPDSVEPKPSAASHFLKLHLRQAGFPDQSFDRFGALSQLASDVMADPGSAAAFIRDPSGYLAAAGFANVQVDHASREFRLVLALADPAVRAAAVSRDPIAFLNAIRLLGFDTGDLQILSGQFRSQGSTAVLVVSVAVVAVVVAIVAILVEVTIEEEVQGEAASETAQLAAALGGKPFAVDVVKAVARNRADAVIRGIESGQIPLPPTVSKQEVIKQIESALARHTP